MPVPETQSSSVSPISPSHHGASARPTAPAATARTLDELGRLDAETLRQLYQDASVPRIPDLSGDLRGRLLAVPSLSGPLAGAVRALAGSSRFPWRGKSFTPIDDARGEGLNRVVRDGFKVFRFETFVGPSRAGDFDAVQLDYDNPGNPFFIRAIKDELRELSHGLYLGQAYLQLGDKTHLGLYFGLAK